MNLSDIIHPQTLTEIMDGVKLLIERRNTIQAEIDRLDTDGCINGHLVPEWRVGEDGAERGPYWRLTFYTDPKTGHKPKPKYIGQKQARIERAEQQIENYQQREQLLAERAALDEALNRCRRQMDYTKFQLDAAARKYRQVEMNLVTLDAGGQLELITK